MTHVTKIITGAASLPTTCSALRRFVVFGRNACNYPDIKKKSEEHKRAWTIYSVLRHARSWHENPKGGITVNYDEPLNLAGGPMPKCRIESMEGKS